MKSIGAILKQIVIDNPKTFRMFSPDEVRSMPIPDHRTLQSTLTHLPRPLLFLTNSSPPTSSTPFSTRPIDASRFARSHFLLPLSFLSPLP
jgi:hypothetical protein